jgi:hypothetical protein
LNPFANQEDGVFTARELGTEAGRILARCGSAGKIFASLSGGIYFLTDDQEFFWVSTDQYPMHRRCVRTAFLPARHRAQPGQRFRTEPPLILGDSFAVDLRGAKEWNPSPIVPDPETLLASIKERCKQLIGFMQSLNSGDGLSQALPSLWAAEEEEIAPDQTTYFFSRLLRPVFEIGKACRRRDPADILEKGKELIGLGPGLTPSGDDFMGGLLFSAFFLKKSYPEFFFWDQNRVTDFIAGARSRTHPISHAFLSDFAAGHAPAPLYEVMGYLLQGRDFERAVSAMVEFLRFGHSSGADMLAGMMTGMLLVSSEQLLA